MPPAALLLIIALGLVLAYALPQRVRERGDYALVRTEDRYSAEMRVVRSTAQRLAQRPTQAPSASGETPLLVTGAARVRVAQVGAEHMSRPHGPLDRAATQAQREQYHLLRDRLGSRAERAYRARRRGAAAVALAIVSAVAWALVPGAGVTPWLGAVTTGALVSVVAYSVRTGVVERRALEAGKAVVREVQAAAAATRALSVVSEARARGDQAEPSDVATQAIRIITATDLAPLQAPALRRAAAQATAAEPVRAASPARSRAPQSDEGWRPRTMPVPAYALKASVRQRQARELSEDDYAASSHADYRAAVHEAAAERAAARERAAGEAAPAAQPAGATLDAILAKRKRASA